MERTVCQRCRPERAARCAEKTRADPRCERCGRSSDPSRKPIRKLVGDRRGQQSIRVNAQWRICFVWSDGGAEDVELVDYH
ncbi:MAG: type II toxin-antitoxin system RelE/ParE family toxin [Leucobacter sp.]